MHWLIQAKDLQMAVRRADIFARDDNHTVRFHLEPLTKSLVVEGASVFAGNTTSQISVDSTDNPDSISISFNATFVLDILDAFKCTEVMMDVNKPDAPVCIRPRNVAGQLVMIMPIMPTHNYSPIYIAQPQPVAVPA